VFYATAESESIARKEKKKPSNAPMWRAVELQLLVRQCTEARSQLLMGWSECIERCVLPLKTCVSAGAVAFVVQKGP
jgi:hypothetical protein